VVPLGIDEHGEAVLTAWLETGPTLAGRNLTNGFSKKIENLAHTVSLHYMHYNFARPHKTLTKAANGYPTTPAMAAGVADHVWTLAEIAGLLD
jgi:hypothetical protein